MFREFYMNKTTCISCKGIMKRVRILLDEARAIRRNEVYAICEHCKRTGVKCERCLYILGKFKERKMEEQEQLFKQWLSKVKQLLEIISNGNICQHGPYQETADAAELNKLLMELSSPMLARRQLDIGAFPPMELQEDLAQSKDMLQELMQKLRNESGANRYSSDDSLFLPVSETGCVCKHLMDRKTDQHRALEALTQKEIEPPKETLTASKIKLVSKTDQKETVVLKEPRVTEKDKSKRGSSTTEGSQKDKKSTKAIRGSSTERTETVKSHKARKGSSTTEKTATMKTNTADKENKPVTEKKQKKPVASEESKLFKKMLSERMKHKEKAEKQPKDTKAKLPVFGELPKLRTHKRREVIEDFSESVLACDDEMSPKEMITGTKIVSFRECIEVAKTDSVQPLLFKLEADCPPSVVEAEPEAASLTNLGTAVLGLGKKSGIHDRSGVIRYRLSDRQFIDKGWTQLPTTKVLRRMNVYKMLPVTNNWFARHRHRGTMYYESGEKLAMIEEDGQGKWYYKNGMVALEYYNAEEMFVEKRCVVYSHEVCISKPKSQTVLACFDYLGNGVVYDCRGNERLKYNQTEGQLIDERIGPPGFWKWHTLNDPPVLHKAFIDTHSEDSSAFKQRGNHPAEKAIHNDANDAMLAIEFDNFVRAKADKLLQTFKPFQIRMKTVKINDYFSLRVIDQANIYLLFRNGPLKLKLSLGMLLQSKEIVDSESAELSCVETPYDRRPARSVSVQRLQSVILAAKGRKQDCSNCFVPENSE